jgi:hypothetical protein
MAKMKANALAQRAALRGDTETAVAMFTANLAGGDSGAAASLAEIDALRGRWPDVLHHAYVLLRTPGSVYAGNVVTDTLNLAILAGTKCGDWKTIHTKLSEIREHLSSDAKLLQDGDLLRRIDSAVNFARSGGQDAYLWDPGPHNAMDEDARAAKFEEGVARLTQTNQKKRTWTNDTERRRHLFSLAYNRRAHKSAVRLFDQEGVTDLILFNSFAFVASSLVRAGRTNDAWSVVERGLACWEPVDVAQVAPLVVLIDEGLRQLMTLERCDWLLRTPRGSGNG